MFFRRFRFFFIFLLIGGCAAPSGQLSAGWTRDRQLEGLPIQDGASLGTDDLGQPLKIAIPGDPLVPNIRLTTNMPDALLTQLPLGINPHNLTLYPGDPTQMIWVDTGALGDARLTGAVLDRAGNVLRGPTTLSTHPTRDYAARELADGQIITLWNESAQNATLYVQAIDDTGRSYSPIKVSDSGLKPALALDSHGNLHGVWFERLSSSVWTLHYMGIAAADAFTLQTRDTLPARPMPLTAIEGIPAELSIGVDALYVYVLWTQIDSMQTTETTLHMLVFPVSDPASAQRYQLAPGGLKGWRGFNVPDRGAETLTIGAIATEGRAEFPVILTPHADGSIDSQTLMTLDSGDSGSLVRISLARGLHNDLHAAWTVLEPNGTATVFLATQHQ
jgi:hypothetical protein